MSSKGEKILAAVNSVSPDRKYCTSCCKWQVVTAGSKTRKPTRPKQKSRWMCEYCVKRLQKPSSVVKPHLKQKNQ